MRAAIGVEQNRKWGLGVLVRRQHGGHEQGSAEPPGPEVDDSRRRLNRRRRRQRCDLRSAHHVGAGAVVVEVGLAHDEGATAGGRGAHPVAGRHRQVDAFVGRPAPDRLVLRVVDLVGDEDDLVVSGGDDGADLQVVWRGDRLAVEQQPPGAVAVGARDEDPLVRARRSAAHQLDPVVVVVVKELGGATRVGIDGQDGEVALVAGLRRDEWAVTIPPTRRKVGERSPVPCHLGAVAVEAHDPCRHVGVGRAGGRVGDDLRWLVGMGRVGDPPPLHGRRVDARGEERIALRRPPVAALAVHLLGCDELRQTPADERIVLAGQAPRSPQGRGAPPPRARGPSPRRPCVPVGSGRGSNTGPGTSTSSAVAASTSATTRRPPSAATAIRPVRSVA